MDKITNHEDLNQGTELNYSPSTSTISLSEAGNLVENDGVDLDSFFTACEDEKREGSAKNRYRFPLFFTTGELGNLLEIRGGYTFTNHSFLRDGGVRHRSNYSSTGPVTQEWACIIGNGSLASGTNQVYILRANDSSKVNLNRTGLPNELVKVYDSGGNDDRSSLIVYLREWGNTFIYYDLVAEQSLSSILPINYLVPMNTTIDTNGSGTNGAMRSTAYIDANAPYTGMGPSGNGSDLYEVITGTGFTAASAETLTANEVRQDGTGRWFICTVGGTVDSAGAADYTNNGGTATLTSYSGEREVDGSYYAYNRIIDANNGSVEELYEFHQRSLIKPTDVASGETQRGDIMEPAVEWVNGKLRTRTGFFIDNIASADAYKVEQTDIGGTQRAEPQVNTVSITNLPTAVGAERRLRIYNNNTTTEIYSDNPGSATYSAEYTEGVGYTAGDSIDIKFTELDADNSFKSFNTTVIAGATGWALDASSFLESDEYYSQNAVDGTLQTSSFTYDATEDEINLIANVNFTSDEAYAFFCYVLTTEVGIHDAWGGVVAEPGAYKIVTSVLDLKFDNETTASKRRTDSKRVYRDDDVYPVKDPTTSGYGIDIGNWQVPVSQIDTGSVSQATLNAIQSTVNSLPSASDVVDEWETQSQLDPTGFHVNVKEVNGTAQTAGDIVDDISNISGGGLTAAEVVNEWKSQSQLDPTGFHVNVKEVNGTAQTAGDIIDSIPSAADVVNEWKSQSQLDPTGFHVNVKEVNSTAQTAGDIVTILSSLPSSSSIVTALQSAMQADPTGFHVNVMEVAGALQSSADLATLISTKPSAAAIVTAIEAAMQADPTGFHVNVMEVAGTTQTAGDLMALLTQILVQSTLARKHATNLNITDADTGTQKVYDDDSSTLIGEATLYDDADGTTVWDGSNNINRRDKFS